MVEGKNYRITVVTKRIIRLEYSEKGIFTDAPSVLAVNRDISEPDYKVIKGDNGIVLDTGELEIHYNERMFSSDGLWIVVRSTGCEWHYGDNDGNMLGTGRTLDCADGPIPLEPGLFGKKGYAVLDDTGSAVLVNDELVARESDGLDIYFFGFGKDYRGGLKEFFELSGRVPMIPRYVLGNWWSRYHKYSEASYNELLDRMENENIPLSVAVIDMDWHVTDVPAKYGSGWTGYTWNKELFPDYKRFLKGLKKRGLASTLNLHPADGIRAFEDQYERVAKRLGLDPSTEETIDFDMYDAGFRDAYFKDIMEPFEDDGVDFWWIDWQQGTKCGKSDIDPLLLLNHYHYVMSQRNGKRGLIFSRYSGAGAHRYPVGFSGDTITTWKSLRYQPFFTYNASNIGYGWWSHDIGGHMMGDKNEERLIRWIQFGVFSPIMRLHSSNSPFFNKEPWNVSEPYRSVMGEFMRLRHRLVPYLYTMNHMANKEGRMLIEPMYYMLPEDDAAYEVYTQYTFGSELIVGAVCEPGDEMLRMAKVNMLIPDGRWYDIFTGKRYNGRNRLNLYRKLDSIPVLLKEGGIVPESLEDTKNGTENPAAMRLLVGYGKDGAFEMYEDDGISKECETNCVTTTYTVGHKDSKKTVVIEIGKAQGALSLIPEKRSYEVVLYGVTGCKSEYEVETDPENKFVKVIIPEFSVSEGKKIVLSEVIEEKTDKIREIFDIMENAWCETLVKEAVLRKAEEYNAGEGFYEWLAQSDVDTRIKDALKEVDA
ncbi:MAG: glycoside hydrolase family 31 protein [Butyrivibrio sp.]|nr:glycoside hydrolase family 31 protein [Butyrivibrio sp.]